MTGLFVLVALILGGIVFIKLFFWLIQAGIFLITLPFKIVFGILGAILGVIFIPLLIVPVLLAAIVPVAIFGLAIGGMVMLFR